MTFYLSSPGNQMHADYCREMPVLLSFATWKPWQDQYVPSFSNVLIDSGAFSVMNAGVVIDGAEYKDWWQRWEPCQHLEAIAGLDDIRGDWQKSLRNYEAFGGFPTYHETDPPELLDDLIPIARERGNWLGLGLMPPRERKWKWVNATLDRIPDGLHVHFFAGGGYVSHPRIDSTDSTNAWLDIGAMRKNRFTRHLTPAECLEVIVKRYQRADRSPTRKSETGGLFDSVG